MLEQGGRKLVWRVPIPSAEVTGTVAIGPHTVSFCGLGYHDFVQTDIPPWQLPLRELLWGRALGKDGAVIWNRLRFKDRDGATRDVSRGWWRAGPHHPQTSSRLPVEPASITMHSGTREAFPARLRISLQAGRPGPRMDLSLDETRLMLGANVADVNGFRNRLERWLYRTFAGNPVEYKLLSRVHGVDWLEGALAAHERVLWGRR